MYGYAAWRRKARVLEASWLSLVEDLVESDGHLNGGLLE